MIWIASFPRSGNTFFRNILHQVYGLKSSTFHKQITYSVDSDFLSFPFVKTHELPEEVSRFGKHPIIYIVRDGRDALVSIAHHRKDIIEPGSDFYENLKAAVIAEEGSFFGGWSRNVESWLELADMVIKYEDLVSDPVSVLKVFEQRFGISEGDYSKIPSFADSRSAKMPYGSWKHINITEEEKLRKTKLFFRKGKINNWKNEFPEDLQRIFWAYHGDTMEKLGYSLSGKYVSINLDLNSDLAPKFGVKLNDFKRKFKILIEASKLSESGNDGIKRYVYELISRFKQVEKNTVTRWSFDLLINNDIVPLKFVELQNGNAIVIKNDENKEDQVVGDFKDDKNPWFLDLIPSGFKQFLVDRNILVFHRICDFILNTHDRFRVRFRENLEKVIRLIIVFKRRRLDLRNYDMIHITLPQNSKPFKRFRGLCVATIHDLTHITHPQFHTSINVRNSKKGMKILKKLGSRLISVSDSTRNDILRLSGFYRKDVFKVYEACDRKRFVPRINRNKIEEVLKRYNVSIDSPYILCLSTIEPRKNIQNVINAFEMLVLSDPELKINLVIAGKKGWKSTLVISDDEVVQSRIFYTGFVEEQDLSYLYSGAVLFVYASYYEGFGLPLLEAMNCGTPVVYGNNSSMIEVAGLGGVGVDPNNVEEINFQIKRLIVDQKLRDELKKEALIQAQNFSWRNTAIETLAVYQQIIEESDS